MENISTKKLSLKVIQSSGLELVLRATELVFSQCYDKTGTLSFTQRYYGRIGPALSFSVNDNQDLIEFYCTWIEGKVAELRVVETSNDKLKSKSNA